jgi:ligand-binding sensor protein
MQTIASLSGITLAMFTLDGKQCSPGENVNPFCQLVSNRLSPDSTFEECMRCHKEAFVESARTGNLCIKECKYKLKTFVLPLKDPNGKPIFYIIGGHFLSKSNNPSLKKIANQLSVPVEDIKELYKKTPIIDDDKFNLIIDKLTQISDIYIQELDKEKQDQEVSRVVTFISELSQKLSGGIGLKELLTSVVEKVSSTFTVEKCAIALFDDTRQFIEVFASNNNEYADKIFEKVRPGKGATGIVLSTGDIFYSYDAEQDNRIDNAPLVEWKIKTLLTLPLKVSGSIIGFNFPLS